VVNGERAARRAEYDPWDKRLILWQICDCQELFSYNLRESLRKAVLARFIAGVKVVFNRNPTMVEKKLEIWTIGHSTRSIEEFIDVLNSFDIRMLADVRSFPGSRRYPHFNKEHLKTSLADAGIEYQHFPELGGRRRPQEDSHNLAWRNESFRGYADYMEAEEFRAGVARLLEVAVAHSTAIMCAEAVWWRCHRSLISDYLKAKGVEVIHLIAEGRSEAHPFTSAARIVNGELSYRGVLGV